MSTPCTERDRIEAIHNDYKKVSDTLSAFAVSQATANTHAQETLKSIDKHLCRLNGSVAQHQKSIGQLEHFMTNHESVEATKQQYITDTKTNKRLFIAALLALIGSIIVNLVT
jgi:hypothetical protein